MSVAQAAIRGFPDFGGILDGALAAHPWLRIVCVIVGAVMVAAGFWLGFRLLARVSEDD